MARLLEEVGLDPLTLAPYVCCARVFFCVYPDPVDPLTKAATSQQNLGFMLTTVKYSLHAVISGIDLRVDQ